MERTPEVGARTALNRKVRLDRLPLVFAHNLARTGWLSLGFVACLPGSPAKEAALGGAGKGPLAVLSTQAFDYSTGSFAAVNLDTLAIADSLFVTSGDAVVAASPGSVFQINRHGIDTVRRYIPGEWSQPVWEVALADLSNPQDAVVCGQRVFVSELASDGLSILDLERGLLLGRVDLGDFADGDGVGPEPNDLIVWQDRLFVSLQQLDSGGTWDSFGGNVVEVDCETGEVLTHWPVGPNPVLFGFGATELYLGVEGGDLGPAAILALDPDGGAPRLVLDLRDQIPQAGAVAIDPEGAWEMPFFVSVDSAWSQFRFSCLPAPDEDPIEILSAQAHFRSVAAGPQGEVWLAAHHGWIDPAAARPGIYRASTSDCGLLSPDPLEFELAPVSIAFVQEPEAEARR